MLAKNYLVAPSLLSANFADMGGGIKRIHNAGGDIVHLDVMDGQFVPNISFGPKMVADLRPLSKLPFDVHLMVEKPENMVEDFAKAGADHITFHYEACVHSHRLLQRIRSFGKKAGISIVPATPAFMLSDLLADLDVILIMTVNPGFGGQEIIPECLNKVRYLDKKRKENGYKYLILVDGGINLQTAQMVRDAGTDVLITGSAFFASAHPGDEVLVLKGQKVV